MKAFLFSGALLLSSLVSIAGGNDDTPSRYPVDVNTSSVTWIGTKVTGSHNGDIQINNGMLTLEDGMITAATVIIDMGTINTLDLQSGGGKESLDGHLMSDDFFGVEQFPTAQFELTQLNPLRGGENGANFSAQGKVTIKGRSENVSFPVKVDMSAQGARISGDITLDRSKFDVQFRSKSFFDAKSLGDKLIYDEFTIGFELVAGK